MTLKKQQKLVYFNIDENPQFFETSKCHFRMHKNDKIDQFYFIGRERHQKFDIYNE